MDELHYPKISVSKNPADGIIDQLKAYKVFLLYLRWTNSLPGMRRLSRAWHLPSSLSIFISAFTCPPDNQNLDPGAFVPTLTFISPITSSWKCPPDPFIWLTMILFSRLKVICSGKVIPPECEIHNPDQLPTTLGTSSFVTTLAQSRDNDLWLLWMLISFSD